MRRRRLGVIAAVAAALSLGVAAPARAASVVFHDDPVEPASGRPYEILPGLPLVTAGPDARLGTADDVIDPTKIGDVDLVVRLGAVPAAGAIPAPAASRNATATATAGLRGAGVAIPFTVYLSDGAVGAGAPYGNVLAANDMTGLPVIVVLFADRDGDGILGPRGKDPRRDVRALAEIEPVGTEVALFDATGRASGTIMTTAGGPASSGGVTLVATATAFTGPYDPAVLDGHVPTGPAITTAQPFLPERDPARIFTDVGPLEVDGTLNPRLRAAALPDPKGPLPLALGVRTGNGTTDAAHAVAGPAVCARVVEPARGKGLPVEPPSLALGTASAAGRVKLTIVAVDRFGNPTDPPPGFSAKVVTDGAVALAPDADGISTSEVIVVPNAKGAKLTLSAAGPTSGELRVLVGGALCQRLAVDARPERDRGGSDALVALKGRADYRSLAAAAAEASDRNGDGRVTITVADGVYREPVPVTRAVDVIGAGAGRTIIDARGLGAALTLGATDVSIAGLTASGGTTGVAVAAPVTVAGIEARGNAGPGFTLAAGGAAASACVARDNGGAGFALTAPGTIDGNVAADNAGAGVDVTTGAVGVAITDNVLVGNAQEGVVISIGASPTVIGNAIAGNYGTGIELEETSGGIVSDNRAAANDGDGLDLSKSDGALVDGNDFSTNGGFGMQLDRSTADFDAAAGTQDAPGSNDVGDNRKGAIDVR